MFERYIRNFFYQIETLGQIKINKIHFDFGKIKFEDNIKKIIVFFI